METKETKENEESIQYSIEWKRIQDIPRKHDLQKFKNAIDSKKYWHAYLSLSETKIWNDFWNIFNNRMKQYGGAFSRHFVFISSAGYVLVKIVVKHFDIRKTEESSLRRMYNKNLKEHNKQKKLLEIKIEEWKKITHQCIDEEKTFKDNNFTFERWNDNRKVVLMIGPTGFGKSTVCNRLMGNNDDIGDISESKTCPFKTAKQGDINPETKILNKKSCDIKIYKDNIDKNILGEYELSIVDTPGAFDTKGYDKACFNDTMKKYFNACGGINIFFIFFKYGGKMDDNYIKLLQYYQDFWGKNMWEHCCIIITRCDTDSQKATKRTAKGLPDTKTKIKDHLNKISGNLCNNVKMYVFGEDNFEESTQEILLLLLNHKKKYMNKKVDTKINKLWDKQKAIQLECQALIDEIVRLRNYLDAYQQESTTVNNGN